MQKKKNSMDLDEMCVGRYKYSSIDRLHKLLTRFLDFIKY